MDDAGRQSSQFHVTPAHGSPQSSLGVARAQADSQPHPPPLTPDAQPYPQAAEGRIRAGDPTLPWTQILGTEQVSVSAWGVVGAHWEQGGLSAPWLLGEPGIPTIPGVSRAGNG